MGRKVYANGREISGKADGNMSNGAMPDVCLTPPPPPAGPLPIPYPNFSGDSDTDDGTRDVHIGGKQVSQKNKSTFKKSSGDEAATKAQGMGVVTHQIQGPSKHAAWSFDVKAENENLPRHMDLTTHNHQQSTPNGAVVVEMGEISIKAPTDDACEELKAENDDMRGKLKQTSAPTTITHGKFQPAQGPAQSVWSCSRRLKGINKAGYCRGQPYDRPIKIKNAKGVERDAMQAAQTSLCEDAVNKHRFRYTNDINIRNPHTSHTEPRIIETLLKRGNVAGGTLTMAINWNQKNGAQDIPCPDCHRLICAAAVCGLNIVLCTEVEQPPCKKDLSKN